MIARGLDLLPERSRGRLDYKVGRHHHFHPWGGAFNGQTLRRELCRRLLVEMKPDSIVETGTYRGVTTEFLAQFDKPVITIESNERFHEFSKQRLSRLQNVSVLHGSSDVILQKLTEQGQLDGNIFAYLDAHWYKHLPLRGEIKVISGYAASFVLLVDDFKVPGQGGYKFDDYGDVGACTTEHIEDLLDGSTQIFFPNIPAKDETDAPRGYCFIARGERNTQFLTSFPELIKVTHMEAVG